MYTLIVENKNGEQLELTSDEYKYQITNIEGLTPPDTEIYMTDNIGDGSIFNHQRTSKRNIVIYVVINGLAEKNRINLYQFFRNGEQIKIYYKNDSRNVYTIGYVEKMTPIIFGNKEECQISILCPNPYFIDMEESVVNSEAITKEFYFPFSIVDPIPFSINKQVQEFEVFNPSDVAVGVTIEIINNATGANFVVNPKVFNETTGEFIALGHTDKTELTFEETMAVYELVSNERIVITTHQNNKTVTCYASGYEINRFSYLTEGSTFFQLQPGVNKIRYTASLLNYGSTITVTPLVGAQFLDINIIYTSNYRGV